jgi:transcription termination factor Rho
MDQTAAAPSGQIELTTGSGVLEVTEKGYGFLRQAKNDYRATRPM